MLLRGRPGRFVATKLAMAELAYDVLLATGIRVQPLPIWEDEWAQLRGMAQKQFGQSQAFGVRVCAH